MAQYFGVNDQRGASKAGGCKRVLLPLLVCCLIFVVFVIVSLGGGVQVAAPQTVVEPEPATPSDSNLRPSEPALRLSEPAQKQLEELASFGAGVLQNCAPKDGNMVAIVSLTVAFKFVKLLPLVVMRMNCNGVHPHIILIRTPNEDQELFAAAGNYLKYAAERDILSFEVLRATNATKGSIGGISRYAAAATDRFQDKFVFLSDMDLVPLGNGWAYFRELRRRYEREQRKAEKPMVYVDARYVNRDDCPELTVWESERKRRQCTRWPRFRSAYIHGYGRGFRRPIPFEEGDSTVNTTSVLKRLYSPELISFAYYGWWHTQGPKYAKLEARVVRTNQVQGPDSGFDEILFGKLVTGKNGCRGSPGKKEKEMNCIKIVAPRVDGSLGTAMLGEKRYSQFIKNLPTQTTTQTYMDLGAAVDMHMNRQNWGVTKDYSPNPEGVRKILSILSLDCCTACLTDDCDRLCGVHCQSLDEEAILGQPV
mmetsp:Transcript_11691/g.19029  ORF Transcript_11691/g.19029 Transcript_11691/m.19029 type:complete len:480 (-) Transcript_11691:79-1518(-)